MSTRPIVILVLLFTCLVAWACGPSPAGIQARNTARARLDKVNAQLTYDQALQAFGAGQFEKASKEINTAIRLNPQWGPYRVLKGRIFLETHRLEKALQSFAAALQIKPHLPEAHYYMGIVYQRWSEDAQAYDAYMTAYEQDEANVQYLLAAAESMVALGQLNSAKRLVESKRSYFEHNVALRHLLARIAMIEDDPVTAVRLYEEARRLNPEDTVLLEELAQAQFIAGLYGDCHYSVKELQKTTEGERPDLLHLEARCLTFLDRLTEARSLYLKLSRRRPTDPDVWIELGGVAWELGDYHSMALCGARVTALAPGRFEGYMLKGINERHHGNLQEAATLLKQAADHATDVALPHLILGRVREQLKDEQGALAAYTEALRVEPESAEAQALFSQLSGKQLIAVQEPGQVRNE